MVGFGWICAHGSRLNWTKVGLKVGDDGPSLGSEVGLNWTKVGLKATSGSGRSEQNGSLNWTKVGLKVCRHG